MVENRFQEEGVSVATEEKPRQRGLSAQQILDADDLKREWVHVDEWGGEVLVQELTAKERDAIDSELVEIRMQGRTPQQRFRESAIATYRVKLVAAAIVDEENHERIFSEKDIDKLGKKSSKALGLLYDKVRELSGINDEDVDEVVGNSETDLNGTSPTD